LCRSGTEYICINDAASAWIEVAQNIDLLVLRLIVPVSTPKIDPFAKFIAERAMVDGAGYSERGTPANNLRPSVSIMLIEAITSLGLT
jgi:hypothetical protein